VLILKKTGLLNRDISALISRLGHQDTICISDAGLAIPDSINLIDVSPEDNVPRLIEVLKLIKKNLFIESILLTEELKNSCPNMFKNVTNLFKNKKAKLEVITHKDFKEKVRLCKGVIRTGEFTAYSNVILVTGADPERWATNQKEDKKC
jgi:D-ribose pyranase